MAASLTSVAIPNTIIVSKAEYARTQSLHTPCLNFRTRIGAIQVRRLGLRLRATPTPQSISDAVNDSIRNAQETCADDPVSGECVAAWDEVEELSAAASDARQKKKEIDSDPLEVFCKDNPETDECRTYED